MRIIDVEQGSPEWFTCRAGIPSASNFDKVVTTKGDDSKQVEKYAFQLAGERITGIKEETYQSKDMIRGVEIEAEARLAYELITGNEVKQVGICIADDGYSCSPDGLVNMDGEIEIKCPTIAVHVSYLLDNRLPSDYFQQVQGQLLVTGREWCDFISYYPGLRTFIFRVYRDEAFILKLHNALVTLVNNVNKIVEKIK